VRGAAAELEVARHAEAAGPSLDRREGAELTRHAGLGAAFDHLGGECGVEEGDVGSRTRVCHQRPADRAVGVGELFEDIERRRGVDFETAEGFRDHQVEEALAREGVEQRLCQRELAVAGVGLALDQLAQAARARAQVGGLAHRVGS
jgi:hypothetical protein